MPNDQDYEPIRMFWVLEFWCCVLFVICVLCIVVCNNAYALDIDKVKVHFLNGDYKSAISAGEKALANYSGRTSYLEELYYMLALSYLKDGNYLRASDIFEILLKEFKDSPFKEGAQVGLGDSYFLRGDYAKAQNYYKELLGFNPRTRFVASLYYRLSQIGFKTGDTQQAKEYLDKLKEKFPSSPEIKLDKELYSLADIYYTVQVGSFAKAANARNLCDKLIKKGYDAYTEEAQMSDARVYRVKVGRLKLRSEAARLENQLSGEGYPTKIIP